MERYPTFPTGRHISVRRYSSHLTQGLISHVHHRETQPTLSTGSHIHTLHGETNHMFTGRHIPCLLLRIIALVHHGELHPMFAIGRHIPWSWDCQNTSFNFVHRWNEIPINNTKSFVVCFLLLLFFCMGCQQTDSTVYKEGKIIQEVRALQYAGRRKSKTGFQTHWKSTVMTAVLFFKTTQRSETD